MFDPVCFVPAESVPVIRFRVAVGFGGDEDNSFSVDFVFWFSAQAPELLKGSGRPLRKPWKKLQPLSSNPSRILTAGC
ncbi:MAG: hypothetical protein V1733_01455 [bacterium]